MNPRSLVIEDNEEAEYGYRSYGETEKEGQTDKVRWVYFRCWDAGVRLSRRSTSLATFRLPNDTRIHFPYACCQLYSIESYSFDNNGTTSFVFVVISRIPVDNDDDGFVNQELVY